ncbi:MAG: hypothetical protein ABIR37_03315 [Candidatus Saccharimonadales bacterium]
MLQDNETSHLTPPEADFISESLLAMRTPEARELRGKMKHTILEWALDRVEPSFIAQYQSTDLLPGLVIARALSDWSAHEPDTETIDVKLNNRELRLVRDAAQRVIAVTLELPHATVQRLDTRDSVSRDERVPVDSLSRLIIGNMLIEEIDHHFRNS